MSNFPKPKHWPQRRDFEANVWPQSRDFEANVWPQSRDFQANAITEFNRKLFFLDVIFSIYFSFVELNFFKIFLFKELDRNVMIIFVIVYFVFVTL